MNLLYLYLIAPLHTGGTVQEGNLLGIARESHTNIPYIPSSTIRGKLRSITTDSTLRKQLWGNDLDDVQRNDGDNNLIQGDLWVGDASILWIPIPSLSHGVIWISSPMLLKRWQRLAGIQQTNEVPEYATNLKTGKPIYLKDAIIKDEDLHEWTSWSHFIPDQSQNDIKQVLIIPDCHCDTLIQMSLWRQVKIKLDSDKAVDGGFRYEEAIPPDSLMYCPWGITSQANGTAAHSRQQLISLLDQDSILQLGGQESLGRGFVQHYSSPKQF